MADRRDQRSPEAVEYRKLYFTREWRQAKIDQLARQPWCERPVHSRPVLATVVNHRTPHKGDRKLFFDPNNHQSVCKPCHDGPIQSEERRGFSRAVGADGWPTDPKHPSLRSIR